MKENKIKKANTSPEGQAGSENMSTADVDAVMKKYDRESNIRVWTGKYKLAVRGLLVAFSLWCIYVTLFATFLEEIRLTSFLGLIILIGFLTYPAKKGDIRENYMPIGDIIFMIAGTGAFLYFTFSANQIINQGTRFAPYQIVIGIIGIAALIELTRRCVGLPILFVAGFFLIYALAVGLTNPAFLGRVKFLVRNLFYTKEGIFSTPVNVCSKYIVVFIIFGAFLERTGISNFFIQLANCIAGKYAGGPAKVAVISSALCGMVSGSSVGNTVTTGSVTIPMMKDTGYGICRSSRSCFFHRWTDHASDHGSCRIPYGRFCGCTVLQHYCQGDSAGIVVLYRNLYFCTSGSKEIRTFRNSEGKTSGI